MSHRYIPIQIKYKHISSLLAFAKAHLRRIVACLANALADIQMMPFVFRILLLFCTVSSLNI